MKKRKPIIAVCLLIIFLMILGFLSYIFFYNIKNPGVNKDEFSNELTKMGETIYKDYYYEVTKIDKSDEELTNFLAKFKDIGLSFNLVELSKYSDENKESINKFLISNKKCSKEKTMVVIYPKEPYTKTDFNTEVKLDCED
ncbi:MAG: hypothetical protein IJ105_02390 [Bacilli bacterium]|nr:hypothetical protein [Bacilli bacterium]